MKLLKVLVFMCLIFSFCQPKQTVGEGFTFEETAKKAENASVVSSKDSTSIGIGPITEISISPDIDKGLVANGEEIFKQKCVACHKIEGAFLGPAMRGVTLRRRPEWIMNMILNPNQMVNEDSLAMKLFIEYDGLPMSNMGLTAKEAREVLEYFRQVDQ